MRKITGILSRLSFPACVIGKSGELEYANPAMRRLHGEGAELSVLGPCVFTPSEESKDCDNCVCYPETKGKCVIPHVTPSSRLVIAAKLGKIGGATVAFYENCSAVDQMEAHATVGEILSLAGAGKRRFTTVSTTDKWKARVLLKELVEFGLKDLETGGARFDLKVSGVVSMDFASLSAARLVIRRIGAELLWLSPKKTLKARVLKKPLKGGSIHVISMIVDIEKQASKTLSNKISAMELRLSRFCNRLGLMMGLAIPAPVTLFRGNDVEIYLAFELARGFAASEGDCWKNGEQSVFDGLSRREREMVALVVEGRSDSEISKEMKITVSTVKQHIKNIYRRTEVKSRLELIFKAEDGAYPEFRV